MPPMRPRSLDWSQFSEAGGTDDGEEFTCLWCPTTPYVTKGVESIRSHLCVHLDYFPYQCKECDHYLPSELMFGYHCELKKHAPGCEARHCPEQVKEVRVDEMLAAVMENKRGNEIIWDDYTMDYDLPDYGELFPHKTQAGMEMDISSDLDQTMKEEEEEDREYKFGWDNDDTLSSVSNASTTSGRRNKNLCGKCARGYVLSGIVKHVWKHIVAEGGSRPFNCGAEGCGYSTHASKAAIYHQRTVHKRDPKAQIQDTRAEAGRIFEERLDEWFTLTDEDHERVLKGRFG